MGHPKSLAKLNAEFQAFIDIQDAKKQINANIVTYYSNKTLDDQKSIIDGNYSHSVFILKDGGFFEKPTSDWSLDHLVEMSKQIKGVIYGDSMLTGSLVAPQEPSVAESIVKISPLDLLITSAAFNAIENILFDFTVNMKTDYSPLSKETNIQQVYTKKELAPGLTIFLCIIDIEFLNTSWEGTPVCHTQYLFDIRFSNKQAQNILNFNEVSWLTFEQNAAQALASKCDTALRELELNEKEDHHITKSNKYTLIGQSCKNRVTALKAKIDALEGN